mmetsp:Transcript_53169/g.116653  ORF Transcript_53169/g.116653 Transcript_53169/m.116653 type:complete len:201 (-) Transcript_53169:393-995(-)
MGMLSSKSLSRRSRSDTEELARAGLVDCWVAPLVAGKPWRTRSCTPTSSIQRMLRALTLSLSRRMSQPTFTSPVIISTMRRPCLGSRGIAHRRVTPTLAKLSSLAKAPLSWTPTVRSPRPWRKPTTRNTPWGPTAGPASNTTSGSRRSPRPVRMGTRAGCTTSSLERSTRLLPSIGRSTSISHTSWSGIGLRWVRSSRAS